MEGSGKNIWSKNDSAKALKQEYLPIFKNSKVPVWLQQNEWWSK